ncbi:MAG: DUF5906 domain-containing protein [Pseudomonadota bacterium]|nr:DUF5906 domain-containing protein [Pseudomonadota bacterium]MDQ6867243.1 DUF5906 domain-containing protein [Pseudomonadota bacterium]
MSPDSDPIFEAPRGLHEAGDSELAAGRLLPVCLFLDEKTTTPIRTKDAPWDFVVAQHTKRCIRPNKSGLMLGGYALDSARSNANVPFRSLIQLDIDTEGVKDKATDRILEVKRAAPALDEVRSGIDAYEWCAASSHWHEPQRGVNKYRIIVLPDRDIQPEEWEALLEAIDDLLHGAMDRNAWQWSQAFYLPSCPVENEADAFFEHNKGVPLPVDEFVRRGREIIDERKNKNPLSERNNLQPFAPMPETLENIASVKAMLSAIDPDIPRGEWRQTCWGTMATGWVCAPRLIREWSEKGAKFAETDFENVVRDFDPNAGTSFGTLVHFARQHGWAGPSTIEDDPAEATGDAGRAVEEGVTIDHFRAYMPMHAYIFTPSREMWPASSVNARLPPVFIGKGKIMSASTWLDINQPVEQMTWAPGEPMLIPDRLVANGGWIEHGGATCFNLYRPPVPQSGGDANKAGPWLDHIRKVFPGDAKHIIKWFAHRVQRPQEKINHALVFGGAQGIGKDTILEPLKRAIGPWNFEEVSPQQMLGRFNGFLKSVILRVSEARDLGDVDRFQFYDHMKVYTASPPDVLRVDEKHLREHYVFNCCGVIITTNHKTDGIYLPADDRRHFVAWSDCVKDDFQPEYWNSLWGWYENGGYAHVAAYLSGLDISSFDPKAPPPKTPAFWDIADANRAPEDAELADVIDKMGNPDATTLSQIKDAAARTNSEFFSWISDRKNRRAIPHRLEKCGYVPVRNDAAKSDGQWKIGGSRVTVYGKKTYHSRNACMQPRHWPTEGVGEKGEVGEILSPSINHTTTTPCLFFRCLWIAK